MNGNLLPGILLVFIVGKPDPAARHYIKLLCDTKLGVASQVCLSIHLLLLADM